MSTRREDNLTKGSTQEEILKTLKSINRTAVETDRISASTAEVVYAQGEQINSIASNAEKIDANLNTSEWLVRGLKGWTGRISNIFSAPTVNEQKIEKPTYPNYMPKSALTASSGSSAARPSHAAVSTTSAPAKSEFNQEVDKHLDNISSVLGGIHARSLELSDAIAQQVKTVEAVDRSIDKSTDRMIKQHSDIKKLR